VGVEQSRDALAVREKGGCVFGAGYSREILAVPEQGGCGLLVIHTVKQPRDALTVSGQGGCLFGVKQTQDAWQRILSSKAAKQPLAASAECPEQQSCLSV
jgi:hypothetical protein